MHEYGWEPIWLSNTKMCTHLQAVVQQPFVRFGERAQFGQRPDAAARLVQRQIGAVQRQRRHNVHARLLGHRIASGELQQIGQLAGVLVVHSRAQLDLHQHRQRNTERLHERRWVEFLHQEFEKHDLAK